MKLPDVLSCFRESSQICVRVKCCGPTDPGTGLQSCVSLSLGGRSRLCWIRKPQLVHFVAREIRRNLTVCHGESLKPAGRRATMRRFSSEGNLLDLDFLPWRRVALKNHDVQDNRDSGTYTPHTGEDELNRGTCVLTPTILEPKAVYGEQSGNELTKQHSVSVETLSELGKQDKLDKNHLSVCIIGEGCRAYSDSQLNPNAQGSTESMERDDMPPRSPSSTNPFSFKAHHSNNHKPKLSAAKLHLRSLFGQSPHSSNSNLSNTEQKDSVTERRSRLLFMRQWSQMGPSKKRKISREELEKWAESLNTLLLSQTGVSVFGAFLRSEFSEENLQFYLACEQYKHSSNNFSLQRRAKDICSTYIQPGAPREVNLDSKTRDLSLQLLQAPSHASLSLAQKRIYSLLDMDCYPRFLQSDLYLSLLREADKETHVVTHLASGGGTP